MAGQHAGIDIIAAAGREADHDPQGLAAIEGGGILRRAWRCASDAEGGGRKRAQRKMICAAGKARWAGRWNHELSLKNKRQISSLGHGLRLPSWSQGGSNADISVTNILQKPLGRNLAADLGAAGRFIDLAGDRVELSALQVAAFRIGDLVVRGAAAD